MLSLTGLQIGRSYGTTKIPSITRLQTYRPYGNLPLIPSIANLLTNKPTNSSMQFASLWTKARMPVPSLTHPYGIFKGTLHLFATIMSSLRDFQRNLATFCYHNVIPTGFFKFSHLHIFTILSPIAHHSSLIASSLIAHRLSLRLSSLITHRSSLRP